MFFSCCTNSCAQEDARTKAIRSLPPPAHPSPPLMIDGDIPVMMVGTIEEEDKRKAYEAHITHAQAKTQREEQDGDSGELVPTSVGEMGISGEGGDIEEAGGVGVEF
mmetsp:Transcript_29318/g.68089  ORF Transcript_29318/g.68089 Transcript_29318/m.68089 type:complete len:107 (+) Transcript_29318:136-456(+)